MFSGHKYTYSFLISQEIVAILVTFMLQYIFFKTKPLMIKYLFPLTTLLLILTCASCKTDEVVTDSDETDEPVIETPSNDELEAYLMEIDLNDELELASSLYYTKGSDSGEEMVQVNLFLTDSSEVLKIEELMVRPGTNSIVSNVFYYKDEVKCASKQFFEESINDSSYFVEVLSYYDADAKVILSKRRTAMFEDYLDQEAYTVVKNSDCSDARAFDVVNQEGNFETTFQGFVEFGQFTYLIVGENKKVGFASSLVVQRESALIKELRANEKEMIGTPLEVEFGTAMDDGGSQQILLSIIKK